MGRGATCLDGELAGSVTELSQWWHHGGSIREIMFKLIFWFTHRPVCA